MVTMFGFTELPQKVNMKDFSLDKLLTYTVEEFSLKLLSLPLVFMMQQDCHSSRMKKLK